MTAYGKIELHVGRGGFFNIDTQVLVYLFEKIGGAADGLGFAQQEVFVGSQCIVEGLHDLFLGGMLHIDEHILTELMAGSLRSVANLDRRAHGLVLQVFEKADGDGTGLFAGGAGGYPDADGVIGASVLQQGREDLF